MFLTKIEAQKKKANRFNLYGDDHFLLGISEAVLIQFGLYKGMELTNDLLDQIEAADHLETAYQKALSYLNTQLRTEKEVQDKLVRSDIPPHIQDQVIQRLKEMGWLDDGQYAQAYTNQLKTLNRKGPKAIQFDLSKKGIPQGEIEAALLTYSLEEQVDNALSLGQAYLDQQGQVSAQAAKAKVYQHLQQKGYDREVVEAILPHLSFDRQNQGEEDLAYKQAVRWALAAKDPDLSAKTLYQIKGKLYQKAFSSEVIEKVLARLKEDQDLWT